MNRSHTSVELTSWERWLVIDALQRQAKQHDRRANALLDMGDKIHEEQQRDACLALAAKVGLDRDPERQRDTAVSS